MIKAAIALLLFATGASAQVAPPSQLDFLAGSWEIRDPDGKAIGTSRIELAAPGAMLHETRTVGDEPPQPLWFSMFERHGRWSQLFVGARGMLREFVTTSEPGTWPIVMAGDVIMRDGKPGRFRLTMRRESDDQSSRVLELSRDAGVSWSPVFHYIYVRKQS
jgi:hypothetical protein